MAARVEFEMEWLPKFSTKNNLEDPKKNYTLTSKSSTKTKALNSIASPGLKSMLDSL
jgi:hypothetical protein